MPLTRRLLFLVPASIAATFLGACDDGVEGGGQDSENDGDAAAEVVPDVGWEEGGDGDAGPDGEVGPETIGGSVRVEFDLAVDGRGRTVVGNASFAHSVGLVRIGRDLRALAYEVTDWTAFGYVLYHVLAPEAGNLHVLYLYCGYASARSLDWIWHEAYGVPMDYEAGTGDCFAERVPVDAVVTLDALSALPDPESIASGLVVNGPDAVLDDAGGFIVVAGREYHALPFGLVDCTTDCSADPIDGWWEIHTVLRDPVDDERCFGTVYLMVASADAVEFDYGFCLESLTRLPDTALGAAWHRTAAKRLDPSLVPAGPFDARAGHVLRPGPRLRSSPRTSR